MTALYAAPLRAQQAEPNPDSAQAAGEASDGQVADVKQWQRLQDELEQERAARQAVEKRLEAVESTAAAANTRLEEVELMASLSDEESLTVDEELLRFYGFMDAGFQRIWLPKSSFYRELAPTRASTFVLGNVNLYLDAQPSDNWRALVELRVTGSPHGTETGLGGLGGTYERTNTTVFDTTSVTNFERIQYAALVIERAWLEWSYNDLLQVRGGLWFTPWGIWNVDHGTPTLIALTLPFMVLEQSIPRRLTGLQVLGTLNRPPWSYGYHLGVSNGRQLAMVDFTDNKSVNARLWARYTRKVELQVGLTGWWGISDNIRKDLTSIEPVEIEVVNTVERREWAVGSDLSLDVGGTRLRLETLVHSSRYAKGKRAAAALLLSPVGTFDGDRILYAMYATLAHRIGWAEGYLHGDLHHVPSRFGDAAWLLGPGVNVHFSPHAQLKLQYGYVHFFDMFANDGDHSVHDFQEVAARWVLAF